MGNSDSRPSGAVGDKTASRLDFHDLLKARAMPLGKPIQLVLGLVKE